MLAAQGAFALNFRVDKDSFIPTGKIDFQVSSGTLVSSTTGFQLTPSGTLTINNINLKPGQSWTSLTVSTLGAVDITVTDQYGITVVALTTVSGIQTFSLNGLDRNLNISIDFSGNEMEYLDFNYSGERQLIGFPNPYLINKGDLHLRYDLPCDSQVTLIIYDAEGKKVKEIHSAELVQATSSPHFEDTWNGRSDNGRRVSSGVYTVWLNVRYLDHSYGEGYHSVFKVLLLR